MAQIDPKDKKYMITFKRKDLRPNQRDDKFELFRHAIGLEDVRDILDLSRYKDNHMTDPIEKTVKTVTDINSYDCPFVFARLTEYQLGRLRRDPNVLIVEEDVVWHATEEVEGWQVPKVRAPSAWAAPLSIRGVGANVASIDTGVNPHLDLGVNLKINQNFTARTGTAAEDANRHGTHVAGITGALQGNNEGIQGIAPGCNIWNLRAGDNLGAFQQTDSIEAIQYATQNSAHVINMSFGGTQSGNTAGEQAVTAAWNADIILFGAAGNTGIQEAAFYPAAYPNVLGISNLQEDGALFPGVGFGSSWGTYVDFTTPGHNIVSLAENNLYRTLSGTSMACPAASGVAALCVQAYNSSPACPPRDPSSRRNVTISNVLAQTAIKSGLVSPGPVGSRDIRYGYGLLQASTAVASLKGVTPTALLA